MSRWVGVSLRLERRSIWFRVRLDELPDGLSVRVWDGCFGWRLNREGCLGDISLSSPVFLCYMAKTFINNRWH